MTTPCLPAKIKRVRHVGYYGGVPLVREIPDVGCGPPVLNTKIATRHVGYHGGTPLQAWAYQCCKQLCTDAEVLAGDCYKREACWPFGPNPTGGLSKKLLVYFFDSISCWSSRYKNCWPPTYLTYDSGDGKWHGTVVLRGGTVTLTFDPCPFGDPYSGTVRLSWSGCGESGSVDVAPSCTEPLTAAFQFEPHKCCDCNFDTGTPPSTDTGAQIVAYVLGNCPKVVMPRHVGYTGGIPVLARTKPCPWNQDDCYACSNMTCPLVAEITGVSGDCPGSPIEGTYQLDYNSGQWTVTDPPIGLMTVTCTNLGTAVASVDEPTTTCRSCGYVRLTVFIQCGADNTGTGTADVPACDLEDLDVTVPVTMTFVTGKECCEGVVNVRLMR